MKPYLYIFEDGSCLSGPYPSKEDRESIADGLLTVIDPENLTEYSSDDQDWIKIEKVEGF